LTTTFEQSRQLVEAAKETEAGVSGNAGAAAVDVAAAAAPLIAVAAPDTGLLGRIYAVRCQERDSQRSESRGWHRGRHGNGNGVLTVGGGTHPLLAPVETDRD
jgi:hypothetical protein